MGKVNGAEQRTGFQQGGQQHDLANEDAQGVEVAALPNGQPHANLPRGQLSAHYWPEGPV
jgi:hypothetical protein